uniref:Globin family profile domain-containing protein n=1 Tax=Plectus sambesii TaxID=2011161 RepID=A0A914WEM3_9BILA
MGSCQSRQRRGRASISPAAREPSTVEKSLRNVFAFSVNMVPFHFEPLCQLDLSEKQKEIVKNHWTTTLLAQKPDLFYTTMVFSVNQSPKMNDVIAAGCQTDGNATSEFLVSAKMERMAMGVRDFFARQIFDNNLDSVLVANDARDIGAVHASYAQYGFKPAFLDIWQSNAIELLQGLLFEDLDEKVVFLSAWRQIIGYVSELMMVGYDAKMQSIRAGKRRATIHEQIETQNLITRRIMSLV